MLDFAPLTQDHLVFFAVSFAVTFFVSLKLKAPSFRHANSSIFYAGVVIVAVVGTLSLFAIENITLRTGLIAVAVLTIVVGRIDETRPLSAAAQLVWQAAIAAVLIGFGWTIPYVTNPVGEGVIFLGSTGALIAVAWILLLMNAVNWLDGVDGLAGSISLVAFVTLAAVSLLPATQDATTLSLAIIGAGAALGFLLLNLPPAKVYLGTTGSWFLGLFVALTAIIGGGKIATTLLVLAIPIADVLFVVIQRLKAGQKPWVGDTKHHLHHHLLRRGWSPRQILLAAAGLTAVLGYAAVAFQTQEKIWLLAAVALIMGILVIRLAYELPARK